MSTTPDISKEVPGDERDDVLFNSIYGIRSVELNRPKKLNSLNGSMARKILPRLKVRKTPGTSKTYNTKRWMNRSGRNLTLQT